MKVRIIGMPAGNNKGKAWEVGQELDLDDERAAELVNAGHAQPVDQDAVVDVPSELRNEQLARMEYAKSEYATPQEKRQAAVEAADLQQRPRAWVHETTLPTRQVPDADASDLVPDKDELFLNKGPVEARPDSAGVQGVPDLEQVQEDPLAKGDGKAAATRSTSGRTTKDAK